MWTHPGKKLIFMGCEFGTEAEFNADAPFPWPHPYDEKRQGLMRLVADLNRHYRSYPQLHRLDCSNDGFRWVVGEDETNTVFAWRRSDGNPRSDLIVILNATPVPRHDYRIGVPYGGRYREIFNSDATLYGGSNLGNDGALDAFEEARHGEAHTLALTLPPLGLLILEPQLD
jgi:1,4-alpha-glucan branching enzyme